MPRTTKKSNDDREVIYDKYSVSLKAGDKAITQAQAEQLLGWHVVADGDKGEYLLKVGDEKIRCANNVTNRPLYSQSVDYIKQEILRGRWQFNGEPVIIGKTGLILNGQHTLVGFILACREWEENEELYPFWEEEPTLEKLCVFGVDESDEVVNTMDTCKPRSLADVFYRSEYFKSKPAVVRKKAASTCAHAVRFIWDRTGVANAFGIRTTHSEFTEFLKSHPSILDSISFIHEEDGKEKKISRYLTPGYASGLLYLMSVSASSDDYFKHDERTEAPLNFDNREKAEEFFILLSSGSDGGPIRKALGQLIEDGDSTKAAKLAVLIKAWNLFVNDEKITPAKLKLAYHTNDDDVRSLAETPSIGGIDTAGEEPDIEPSKEEKEAIAKREQVEAQKKTATRKKATRKKTTRRKKTEGLPEVGSKVWCVHDNEEENWQGTLESVEGPVAKVKVAEGFAGAGNVFEHPFDRLSSV